MDQANAFLCAQVNDSVRNILNSDNNAPVDGDDHLVQDKQSTSDLSFVDGLLNSPSSDSKIFLEWRKLKPSLTF